MHDWFSTPEYGYWTGLAAGFGMRVAGALVILFAGMKIVGWIADALGRALARAHIEQTAALFLARVAQTTMQIVLLLAAVQLLGVPMTSMLAVLGAAGLAIGLALKDSLSNIASGVMLVALRPFRVGDIVTIGGVSGKVELINMFQTRLRGADNQTVTLPNALITADSIVNLTPDTMRRIELVIGIGYDDDIDQARAIVMEILRGDRRVLGEPAPAVLVYALAESSVDLGIRCHVANADWFAAKCELTERIKKAFDDAGVSIPYPQRDTHVYTHAPASQEPARAST
ncbi:small conductance mechanosensitive channel [Dokdonella fugitiva]|uniref:Small-conductance mechanosensitive channel n=1 Tax=Dokdonella fugitiva TaxID=328517 RepID=A0A839EY14_9GAMM|nr:mechanosensitive ion channel domain-containing protein [Dokdonella fugitiva]MBA8888645.1 small conductance mechanosensitive channel [Dokdonella fugitiva]